MTELVEIIEYCDDLDNRGMIGKLGGGKLKFLTKLPFAKQVP